MLLVSFILQGIHTEKLSAQCQPFIKVDGNILIANETVAEGLKLPLWLTSGQTLACGATVKGISLIEFTENGSALEYSQVMSLTSATPVSVPTGKVWKVESIMKQPIISGGTNKVDYVMEGTSIFTVPSCAEYICIEVWGGGGGGQGNQTSSPYSGGGGGGGGSYGQGCFTVVPGTNYTVTVGGGGLGGATSLGVGAAGGTTSVGSLISAGGGSGGTTGGGNGGTSTAPFNVPGFKGLQGWVTYNGSYYIGGAGGYGANGGTGGGYSSSNGSPGSSPGGGGSGAGGGSSQYKGGLGAAGKVSITW
ncbi:MAG: hypothetical protein IT223_08935 [Crocinitomicaceae bacterium]|nr:hypothetical protein [Crocinitomicaceae bacterium]